MPGVNSAAEEAARTEVANGNIGAAIKILDRAYRSDLFLFCHDFLGSRPTAEDALQTTFMFAYEGIRRYERRGALRAWLFTIARHRCIDYLRASGRSAALRNSRYVTATLDDGPEILEGLALLRCLSELPSDARAALLLRYQHGFTYPELSEMLDEQESTLAMRVARALAALRRCFGLGGEPA